jgi:integrase
MGAVEGFYRFVEERLGQDRLDDLIADLDSVRLPRLVEAYFGHLRNAQAETGKSKAAAWNSVSSFLAACVEAISKSRGEARPSDRELLARLRQLGGSLRVGRKKRRQTIRALPAEVVEDLWDIMQPESPRNPFRDSPSLRFRNFLILLLLLYVGLRRSEATILAVDAAHSDFLGAKEHHWLDVRFNPYEEDDGRSLPPSLKNEWAVRQIPLAEPVAVAIDRYIRNYRGRQPHTFLLASQWRRGLALNGVNAMFDKVSARLSKAAGRALWNRHRQARVSPHDLRHTCSVVRLKQFVSAGVPLEEAIGKLRNFFGWSPESSMPGHYARAYFDERLAEIWQKDFDAHISFVRSLPR